MYIISHWMCVLVCADLCLYSHLPAFLLSFSIKWCSIDVIILPPSISYTYYRYQGFQKGKVVHIHHVLH